MKIFHFGRTWTASKSRKFYFLLFTRAKYIDHYFSIGIAPRASTKIPRGHWHYSLTLTWKNRNPSARY